MQCINSNNGRVQVRCLVRTTRNAHVRIFGMPFAIFRARDAWRTCTAYVVLSCELQLLGVEKHDENCEQVWFRLKSPSQQKNRTLLFCAAPEPWNEGNFMLHNRNYRPHHSLSWSCSPLQSKLALRAREIWYECSEMSLFSCRVSSWMP